LDAAKQPFDIKHVSEQALTMALEEAVLAVLGKQLSKASLCVLLAHSAHEQGSAPDGSRNMPNYNGYGIKAYGDQDYFESPTKEGHDATEVRVVAKFRSFKSLTDGAKAFVRLLAKNDRYAEAWARLEDGDPIGYAFALGPQTDKSKGGYYTGSNLVYSKSLARHWSYCALRSIQYGTTTDEVRRFQLAHELDADGLIGPKTRAALKVALGG
jgi:hypothetical protein